MKTLCDVGDTRHPDYVAMRKGCPVQGVKARELHDLAGVPQGPCGYPELEKFQNALPDYQIKVLSVDKPHMLIFVGPDNEKRILLVKVGAHYHACNSFSGFLDKSYYCHECDRGYDHENRADHPCDGKWCFACETRDCEDFKAAKALLPPGTHPKPDRFCSSCNRFFFGPSCLEKHLSSTARLRSLCEHTKRCLSCQVVYDAAPIKRADDASHPRYRHRCGVAKCPFCEQFVPQDTHQCFIEKIDKSEDEPELKPVSPAEVGDRPIRGVDPETGFAYVEKNKPLFVYADYEATTSADGTQTPILLCCESEDEEETHTFYGRDCTAAFFDYLDELTLDEYGDPRSVITIFHNFKGYDGLFVLKYLYDNHREVQDQITVGTKILSLRNHDLVFKDSLCFLPFPLASFPATFGLTEQCKGFFPHLFNTEANQRYRGPIPEARFYDPDGMSEKKKTEFLRWHADMVSREYDFDLRREMENYCISDVKLLKAGCQKFQEKFASHADFNPMEKCITIASACNRFWRKKLLPENTIAIEPPRGWHCAQTNTSVMARQWLAYENHRLRLANQQQADMIFEDPIRTATNGGEVRIRTPAESYVVDGFDATTNTVYEFHGCLWHGCPTCFPKRNIHSKLHLDRTVHEMFQATLSKHQILRANGYLLRIMWECQWREQSSSQQCIIDFLATWKPVPPLDPREAFFGGRTNACTLYKQVEPGGKILYVDVTSLYPWVNATAEYPVGHPLTITNPEDQDIASYFGVALVDVIPPYELYHPVLPSRQGEKLTFPLCTKCVADEMEKSLLQKTSVCKHTDDERTMRGTWCTPGLLKAREKGYRIVQIHEVWHFPRRVKGLFKDYVNQWLKVKQESSGYPSWADTEDKKEEYRENYLRHQGIALDPNLISKNAGRKATAKLMLNSFWGKFGENLDKTKVVPVTTTEELFAALYRNTENVERIRICNDDLLELVIRQDSANQMSNGRQNIFIAAFTTCYARLKLYRYLDLLKQQVLYFDTDSVVYSWLPGQPCVPLGDYLGDMTNEIDDGDHITEFASAGPKNYGYTTASGKVTCKVRGFTLNVRGSRQLNYEILKQNVLDEIQRPADARRITNVDNPHFFTRDPVSKRIRVLPRTKQYRLVLDKRVVNAATFNSYPYGYHKFFTAEDEEMADILLSLQELNNEN